MHGAGRDNDTLEEYKVIYLDGSSDYIPKDDFGDVHIILL